MGKKLSSYFIKEDILITIKHLKDTQHLLSLGNCKLKPQWSTTSHPVENVCYRQLPVLVRMWRNWNPLALLVGISNNSTTLENSLEFSWKVKYELIIQLNNFILSIYLRELKIQVHCFLFLFLFVVNFVIHWNETAMGELFIVAKDAHNPNIHQMVND